MKTKYFLYLILSASPLFSNTYLPERTMSANTAALNPAEVAIANLTANLMQAKVNYETLIQNIDQRLAMPLPEAAHPLSQTKLEIIWGLYREAISARKENAASQHAVYDRVVTALTDGSSLEVCGQLLDAMSSLLTPLQKQAKEWDTISLYLAREIVVLAPHLEHLTH